MSAKETNHTPGPWEIMADPINKGFHEYHDNRWIATGDAQLEMCEYNENDWTLRKGRLICMMRDGQTKENAQLIAAAPELLAALKALIFQEEMNMGDCGIRDQARAAIAKAEGGHTDEH
jgi:hypothetical protein